MKKPRPENAIDYSLLAHPKAVPVRLVGRDMEQLRLHRLQLDRGRCVDCKRRVSDSLPAWHPLKFDLAHVTSRGAGGGDIIENTRTKCHECHMAEHAGQLTGDAE